MISWRHGANGPCSRLIYLVTAGKREGPRVSVAFAPESVFIYNIWINRNRDHMVDWTIDKGDPARLEIVERAKMLGITGTPDKAVHGLGSITLADGRVVQAHVVHAVDPIITDGHEVVLINRKNAPGKGKPALPGGFLDQTKGGGVELAVQAAAREAMEEVGTKLDDVPSVLIGKRNMDRPFDVRVAQNNGLERAYGIKEGDVFMVSTQAVRFDVIDLGNMTLIAGDDAEPDRRDACL